MLLSQNTTTLCVAESGTMCNEMSPSSTVALAHHEAQSLLYRPFKKGGRKENIFCLCKCWHIDFLLHGFRFGMPNTGKGKSEGSYKWEMSMSCKSTPKLWHLSHTPINTTRASPAGWGCGGRRVSAWSVGFFCGCWERWFSIKTRLLQSSGNPGNNF